MSGLPVFLPMRAADSGAITVCNEMGYAMKWVSRRVWSNIDLSYTILSLFFKMRVKVALGPNSCRINIAYH